MKNEVTINGVKLTRQQVEAALKELNAPVPVSVPFLAGPDRIRIFPPDHPMHFVIQVNDSGAMEERQNGLYLAKREYSLDGPMRTFTYTLEDKRTYMFLRVVAATE